METAGKEGIKVIKLSIVVPCYNEQEALPQTTQSLLTVVHRLVKAQLISADSKIYYVDDGSADETWSYIEQISKTQVEIEGIKLSRNMGHQNALLAGLFSATGDIVVSIDADLQDDVDAIDKMIDAYNKGADIVYGVRDDRTTDSYFKKSTAEMYYKVLARLGVKIVYNHADYRLMSRRAINALKQFSEVNLFIRGLIPLLGYQSAIVYYARGVRVAGESKYPLKKMLSFAWEGVTSMSVVPLKFVTSVGAVVFLFSILFSLFIVGVKLMNFGVVPGWAEGWASTILPIYILGGIQILCIGILGEYLGKIYKEVKARPKYIIEHSTENNIPHNIQQSKDLS